MNHVYRHILPINIYPYTLYIACIYSRYRLLPVLLLVEDEWVVSAIATLIPAAASEVPRDRESRVPRHRPVSPLRIAK